MKSLLTVAAVLVLLGVALFLWSNSGTAPALNAEAPTASKTDVSKVELAPPAQNEERQPGATRSVFGNASATPSRTDIEALPSELVVEGKVIITEKDGTETFASSGTAHLTTWIGERANGHVVRIKRGRWRLQFVRQDDGTYRSPDGGANSSALRSARITVSELSLADVYGATSPADTSQELAFGVRDATIRVRRLRSLTLRVEDAQTGAALEHVSIHRVTNAGLRPTIDAPGAPSTSATDTETLHEALVTDVTSPIRLTREQRFGAGSNFEYWVGSPGYAWKRIGLDLTSDGERVIPLGRASELTVHLEGTPPEAAAFLRVRTGPEASLVSAFELLDSEPIRIRGLAAGNYILQLETGNAWSDGRTWARASVEVVAGGRHEQTLHWGSASARQTTSLAGTLFIPAEWQLLTHALTLSPIEVQVIGTDEQRSLTTYELRKLGDETYAFQFDDLSPGEYQLSLVAINYAIDLTLPESGLSSFRFEIPPPVDIKLRLLDEGVDSDVVAVHWGSAGSARKWPIPGHHITVIRWEGEEIFDLRVPQGEILLIYFQTLSANTDYVLPTEPLLASPGSEHTLHLRRACTARFILLDGDTRIPWPRTSVRTTASQAGGDGTLACIRGRNGNGRARADQPGHYRIAIPAVPGFAAHAPVEVEFVEGATTEIQVKLVRSR